MGSHIHPQGLAHRAHAPTRTLVATDRASGTRVSEIASRDPLLLEPEDRLADAVDDLVESGRSIAVAIDGRGRPVGIVTLADAVLALCDDDASQPRSRNTLEVPLRRGRTEVLGSGFHVEALDGPCVRDAMRATIAIPGETSIAQAAAALAYEDVAHAVVTARGIAEGVISWQELLRWVAQESGYVVPARGGERSRERAPGDRRTRNVRAKGVVIVIEDDADVATTMAEVLHDEGYGVIATPNGRAALEVLRSLPTPPGLILLDLMMPEMNGWQFRDAQVQDRSLASIPVVIMTAHADRFDREELYRPSALLHKPLSTDVLLDTVARHYQVPN